MSETANKDPLALPKEKEKLRKSKEDMETVVSLTKDRMQELVDDKVVVFAGITEQLIGSLIQYSDKSKKAFDRLSEHSGNPLTSSTRAIVNDAPPTRKAMPTPTPQPIGGSRVPPKFDCDWHYLDSSVNQIGPLKFAQLKTAYQTGEISGSTHVFGGEMSDWLTISAVPDLQRALSA